MLSNLQGFAVKSNRESGNGRLDIYVKSKTSVHHAAVFELKIAENIGDLERKCRAALCQIAEKGYADELIQEGYQNVAHYGVAFLDKQCIIMKNEGHWRSNEKNIAGA